MTTSSFKRSETSPQTHCTYCNKKDKRFGWFSGAQIYQILFSYDPDRLTVCPFVSSLQKVKNMTFKEGQEFKVRIRPQDSCSS